MRNVARWARAWEIGTAAAWTLLLSRLVVGFIWFGGAVAKTPWTPAPNSDYPRWGWFTEWIRTEQQYAIPPYKWFLDNIVIPNIEFFGWLQFLTEVALTLGFVFGILMGLTGLVGALWAFNIALGAFTVPNEPFFALQLFVLMPLVLGVTKSGRILGVDVWLRPKLLASPKPWLRKVGDWAT